MSFWAGINWSLFSGNKGALNNPDKGEQVAGPTFGMTKARVVVNDERAMKISAFFACVRLLVQTGATMPLSFFTKTAVGREPLTEDHQLVNLLKYRPNTLMTAKQFRQAMFTNRVMRGNAYAVIHWIGSRPVSIIPLKSDLMQKVERSGNELLYHYQKPDGIKVFRQHEIFHLKGFSADGVMGLSPLGYAREALGLSVAADESASKSINGVARATLSLDDYPDAAQKEQLRAMYGGDETVEFKDNLMIIPGGMKYQGVGINPDDMQLLESRQFQVPEICRFFGVPAVMIDGAAGATAAWPASYEQQVLSFLTFGLRPYLEEWEDTIINSLLSPAEAKTIYAEHNVEGLLRTDSAARSTFYSTMVQNGIMSRAEVRRKENLSPKEGSDELTVQVNMTNLEDLPKVNEKPKQEMAKEQTNVT